MKITNNITLIDGTMANCYVVNHEDKIYLIDAGMKGSGRRIIQYFERENIKPDIVLITHYHPDHIGGLYQIEQRFRPEIYVPDQELDVVLGKAKVIPANSFMSRLVASMSRIQPALTAKPLSKFTQDDIKVIETPGHTPQSSSYLFEKDKAIFVGDAIFVDRSGEFSINKSFTLDMKKAEESRTKILNYKGYLVVPGHGPVKKI